MANKIEVRAGYYEWNLYINESFIYSFGDVKEIIFGENGDYAFETLQDFCLAEFNCMVDDFIEKEKDTSNLIENKQGILNAMERAFSYYYDL